jgi:formylglycine-generating enzyme required for sulfatase activity
MKTKILVIVGLLMSLSTFSQNLINNAQDSIGLKLVSGGRYTMVVKPGLTKDVAVDDFWMSDEISNKEFRKFYWDISNNPNDTISWFDVSKMKSNKKTSDDKMIKPDVVKESYKDILNKIIDLSVCNSIPNKENYFTDSKYDNYPVVGVNYYGAMYYCIWRSNLENNKNAKGKNLQDYRLPTRYEWLNVPRASTDYETGLHEVQKGKKNKLGLFNMNGNVAEWTSTSSNNDDTESKFVMGYSWKSDSSSRFTEQVSAEKATDYIGFRIVKSSVPKANSQKDFWELENNARKKIIGSWGTNDNENARFAFFEDSVYYPDTNLWYEYDLIGDTLLITKENNYKIKALISKISSDSMTLNYLDYGVVKTFKKR